MRIHLISFVLFFVWIFQSQGLAQKNGQKLSPEDSLPMIMSEKVDSIKAKRLNHLAYEFRRNDPEKSVKYANQALDVIKKSDLKKGTSYAYFIIGTANMNMDKFPEAYEFLNLAIKEAELTHEKKIVASSYNNIGIIYIKQGKSSEALKYYLKGLEIREKDGSPAEIASSNLNIGNVYYQQENYSEAIIYYLKASKMFEKNSNKFGLANALHNIATVYTQKKNYDSAIFYFKRSMDINTEIADKRGIASGYESIAEIAINKAQYDEAEKNLLLALELYEVTKDVSNIIEVNFGLARIDDVRDQSDKAIKRLEKVVAMSKEVSDNKQLMDAYHLMYGIKAKKKLYKEALSDYQQFVAFKDSVLSEADIKRTVEEKMTYDFNKKAEQLKEEQLKKDIYAEEQLKSQKLFTTASVIVGSLMLILLILAVFAYRDKRRSHQIIETQKALVEEKQQSILDSISYAKKLQQAVLPKLDLVNQLLPQNFILYLPKDIVAGDFYWVTENKDSFYLAVCDCTGHGVPGAFMSLLNIGFLSEAIKERNIKEPNAIFDYVRNRLIDGIGTEGQQDGMDGILVRFDKQTKKLTYAAAHNVPVIVQNGEVRSLGTDKMPVGKGVKMDAFTLFELDYKKGDLLYLFTDGFADQFGGPLGKKFKHRKLEELLLTQQNKTPEEQKTFLANAFREWKGELEQVDDVLVMGIKL